MRRKSIIFIIFLFCVLAGQPAQTLLRKDFAVVEGAVVSKNMNTKELTVRVSDGSTKIFRAEDDVWASAKQGDMVLIFHQKDSNTISNLIVTEPKP